MNLALHQLRIDFKRSRVSLILYFVILACNFMLSAGWIGAPEVEQFHWQHGGVLTPIFILGYWLGLVLIVANVMLVDSPARQDRFLTTRPLPGSTLLTAKILYILLGAILPAVLLEIFSAMTIDGLTLLSVLAGLERGFFLAALAFTIAAFAAHWKNTQGFFIAGIVGFAVIMFLGRLVADALMGMLRSDPGRNPFQHGPTLLTAIQGIIVLGIGLTLTAWICSRRGRKFRYLIPAFVPIAAAAIWVTSVSPIREMPIRTADQGAIDQLLIDGAEARILPQGFHISKQSDRSELHANYSVLPTVSGFPADLEMRWSATNYEWTVDGETEFSARNMRDVHASRYISNDSIPISWGLAQTVQKHIGETVLFRLGSHNTSHSSSLSGRALPYQPTSGLVGRKAQLEMDLVGHALRWKIAADLPVERNTQGGSKGSWKIAALRAGGQELVLLVSEKVVALNLFGGLSNRYTQSRWRHRFEFALYLPAEETVIMGNAGYLNSQASASAARRLHGELKFRQSNNERFTPAQLDGARLLILSPELVGQVEKKWKSAPVTLLDRASHRNSRSTRYESHEQLSPAEFASWFHRLERLDPTNSIEQVEVHLDQILDIVDRAKHRVNSQREPSIRYVASFVPKHLELMIRKLPELTSPQRDFLHEAIKLGVTDEQRQIVIDSIVKVEKLSVVTEERGWVKDAREIYITMARDHRNSRFLHQLIAMEDPTLDPLILAAYQSNPTTELYDLLRVTPRLATRAEQITDQFWKPGRIVLDDDTPRGRLSFGLYQGKRAALEELFTVIKIVQSSSDKHSTNLDNLLRSSLHLPKNIREMSGEGAGLLEWASQFTADDFVFDSVFRKFALKEDNKTI